VLGHPTARCIATDRLRRFAPTGTVLRHGLLLLGATASARRRAPARNPASQGPAGRGLSASCSSNAQTDSFLTGDAWHATRISPAFLFFPKISYFQLKESEICPRRANNCIGNVSDCPPPLPQQEENGIPLPARS